MPERKIRTVEEFLQRFPGEKDLLIDGTERRTRRSNNPKTERKHYSGNGGGLNLLLGMNISSKFDFINQQTNDNIVHFFYF